jgi:hypothetical protein
MADPFDALQTKLQALVDRQVALRWTPPAMVASLNTAVASIASLGATIKISSPLGNGAQPSAGQKTDALSLGVGVSASAAASLSLGVSLGIGVSATASLLTQLTTGLHSAISQVGTLQRDLDSFNAAASLKAGTNGVMPPGQKVEQGPVNSSLRGLHDQLGACQSKASAAAAAVPIEPIQATLQHPRMGVWECSLHLDTEVVPTGKIKFSLDDLEFTATVLADHSGIDGSRAKCRVVGGNGHLSRVIPAHSYSGGASVKVGTVVKDILKACGEDLSDLADGPTLDKTLPRWHVTSSKASDALTALAEQVGAAWRVLRDGTVWFGTETWPEVAPEGTLVNETWHDGHLTLASETPDMVPGTVYQGQKIEHVTHEFGTTLRTHIRTQGGDAVSALGKLIKNARGIDFSREYPCKVVTQNTDGTLQLLPDDEVMKSSGLDHVPIRYPFPGLRVKVKNGARCHLAFAAGDQTRPYATNWELDADKVESVEVVSGGRSAPLARLGDACTFFVAPGVPIPVSGTLSGAPFAGVMTIATPMVGAVNGGNPLFRG